MRSIVLDEYHEKLHLSAQAYYRLLKLARTIADLAGSEMIMANHVAEGGDVGLKGGWNHRSSTKKRPALAVRRLYSPGLRMRYVYRTSLYRVYLSRSFISIAIKKRWL